MAKRRNKVALCSLKSLLYAVQKTLSDPVERKDFEEWYRKRYGKEYVWKYVKKEDEKANADTQDP